MVIIRLSTLILASWILCLTGCAHWGSMQESIRGGFRGIAKHAWVEEEEEEDWIKQAGIEARGDRPVEKQNDPLDFLKSSKTRSIERNLGIH